MNVWYTRSNLSKADQTAAGLDQIFGMLPAHASLGGAHTELRTWLTQRNDGQEALDIAAQAEPQTPTRADPRIPMADAPAIAWVAPDDYGKVEVHGEIVSISAQHIAIRRHDDRVGDIVVHFPRAGFTVVPG